MKEWNALRQASFALALAGALLLSACATPMATDGQALAGEQGLLAIKCSSNVDGAITYAPYVAESTFGSRFSENMVGAPFVNFPPGDKYQVLAVKAGDYMWSKVTFGNRYAWLQGANRFRIKANTITYIGDVSLSVDGSRFRIGVRDDEAGMRAFLKSTYPNYFQSMTFEKSLAELRQQ